MNHIDFCHIGANFIRYLANLTLLLALPLFVTPISTLAQEQPDPRAGIFSTEQAYPSKFVEVDGVSMHYVEGGTAEGQVFLFLHGNPTSSYLWRNVMPHVEPIGRVIAPDLIGFGKSGKPDSDYTFQTHSKYVDGFIAALELKDIVLVIHDWGSMLGLDYARRNPGNIKAVVFMETFAPPAVLASSYETMGPFGEIFRQWRDPVNGPALLIDQNIFIEEVLLKGALTRKLTQAEKDAYREPFLDPASRKPILVWPNEVPIAGKPARNVEVVTKAGEWLQTSETPKLLLYARPGAIIPPESAEWMRANYRNIETVFVGYGSHYIQEDNPEVIGRNIADWYQRSFTSE